MLIGELGPYKQTPDSLCCKLLLHSCTVGLVHCYMTEVLDSKLLVRSQNDISQISFDNIVPIFKYWYGIITVECRGLFQSVYLQLPQGLVCVSQ